MSEPRPLSARALVALVDQVLETGCSAEIKSQQVEIIIRPAARPQAINPADLIDP